MSVEISLEHYNAIVDEFLNGLNKEAEKIAKEIEMIAIEKICEDAKRAYTQIINNWYASYSPQFYNRLWTLKNAADIKITGGDTVTIRMNSDALGGHRLNNEGIYQLTMREGYHGGALNSTYMYRGPIQSYHMWTRPAVQSFSPVRAMKNWAHSYESPHEQEKAIEKIVRKYLSKYEYFKLFY